MQFKTPTAADLSGASQRQLRYWDQTGLLKPSGKSTGHRLYTFVDLVALKAIVALREQGPSLQKIRKAIDHLKQHYPDIQDSEMLASLMLLTDGENVYLRYDAAEIQEVLTSQTVIWSVALGRLIRETQEQTRAMPSQWTEAVEIESKHYHLVVMHDPETDTYTVQCRELPGAIEQGDTPDEALENGKAAIESVLTFSRNLRSQRQRSAVGG